MSNSLKNILQVIVVIILLAGVGYLGLKLIRFNNASSPEAIQTTTNSNVNTETTKNSDSASADAEQCNTSDDCTVISESLRKGGDTKTVIQCLNKAYLSTCETCKTSEEIVAETTKEATCGCVQNLCQFNLLVK